LAQAGIFDSFRVYFDHADQALTAFLLGFRHPSDAGLWRWRR